MPLDQEVIDQQQEQLAVHRRRLAYRFQQQAAFGPHTPPYIVLDVEQTQAEVRSIKAFLREHGVSVEDHPDAEKHAAYVEQVRQRLAGGGNVAGGAG